MMSISMTFKTLLINQMSITNRHKSQINNLIKSLLPILKMMTIQNLWSLKNHEMMITTNSYISNKDNDSKFSMKTNMMIWLIIIKDHSLWTQHLAIHKVRSRSRCNAWCQIKTIKKLINLNISSLRKNKRKSKN